jgi:hypothetical protein
MTVVLHRRTDWHARFAAIVAERLTTRFAWGSHDCCLWASDAVLAMTDTDIADGYRGRYDSALGARRILAEAGGIAAMVRRVVGEPIGRLRATQGDLGLVDTEGVEVLAICHGLGWIVAAGQGLGYAPLGAVVTSWRV